MGKTSSKVKNRYNAKTYDHILLIVPKGQKDTIKAAAEEANESVNMFIQKSVLSRMGLEDWPSKNHDS